MGKEKDKERVPLKCSVCGMEFTMVYGQYRKNIKKPNFIWRCKKCRYEYTGQKSKEKWDSLTIEKQKEIINKLSLDRKNWYDNLSEEEKLKRNKKISEAYQNLPQEEKDIRSEKVSKHFKNYYANMTHEEKEKFDKRCERQAVDFWKFITDDKRKQHSDSIKQSHKNRTDEEKAIINRKISISNQLHYMNLSEEEKKEYVKHLIDYWTPDKRIKQSEKAINNWNSLSREEFQKLCLIKAIQHNNSINIIETNNQLELEFINLLYINKIDFEFQYYNIIKHKDFDKLFPYNHIKETDKINPYHKWDFLIHTDEEDIFIDIDGSVHDHITNDKSTVTNYINFKDSQRPYQTDNLNAYIIRCYKDNLYDKNVTIENIKTNKIISLNRFIILIDYMNNTK